MLMRTGPMMLQVLAPPRLVPIGLRPIAALLVTAAYGAMLVRTPAPTPAAVSLAPAEVTILPPGDPRHELAAVGSPESAAAQASDGLETAGIAEPADVPVNELKPVSEPIREATLDAAAVEPMTIPKAEPPLQETENAIAIPREVKPAYNPDELKPLTAAPAKRETITTKEVERHKTTEPKKRPVETRSASSPARRGQAGSGGGQSNASGQSVAAYASHVRSALVTRTQRIRNLRSIGRVGLIFTINAAGRLASFSIRSSGSAEIDRAVRAALQGINFPPPPGGRFSGSITITVR